MFKSCWGIDVGDGAAIVLDVLRAAALTATLKNVIRSQVDEIAAGRGRDSGD